MSDSEGSRQVRSSRPRLSLPRFQFSLSTLLIAMTAVAILMGIVVVFGNFVGAVFFAVVCCVLPTPLVICALFGRGDVQAFAIGALVPWVALFGWLPAQSFLWIAIWLLVMPGICGVVAAITRRWIQQFGGK